MAADALTAPRASARPTHRVTRADVPSSIVRVVASIPDRIAAAAVCLCVVTSVFLVLGHFLPVAIVLLALVATAATWRLAPRLSTPSDQDALGAAIMIVFAAAWVVFNRHYASELLSVARDPSVYTLRGWWLMGHSSPNIPIGDAAQAVQGVTGGSTQAGGFPVVAGQLQAQGATLLPGLIALAGRFGGVTALLEANVAIGGVALIVLYAFARRLLGPLWGVVPVVALGLTMPMVYFARAPYTEPVALLLIFAGLTILWSAWDRPDRWLFAKATFGGVAVGASQLARIDGLVAVMGGVVGVGLPAVLATSALIRRRGRAMLLGYVVGAGSMLLLGTRDLLVNSLTYYHAEESRLLPLFKGTAAVTVIVLVLAVIPLDRIRRSILRTQRFLPVSLAVAVSGGVVLLLSRPLWWQGHFIQEPAIATSIEDYQRLEGLPLDGTRSYDEQTMKWLSWYLGWPLVLLACVGAVACVFVLARTRPRTWQWAPFVCLFGAVSVLYLNDVSITPIQIWAMRRYLPVVFPGMLILATYVAALIVRRRPQLMWLGGAIAAGIVLSPMLPWTSLLTVKESQGQLAEARAICSSLHAERVVVSGVPTSGYYLPTTRIICGVDSVFVSSSSPAVLSKIVAQWGGHSVALVAFSPAAAQWTSTPQPVISGSYPIWPSQISARPRAATYQARSVYVGSIDADGLVTPARTSG